MVDGLGGKLVSLSKDVLSSLLAVLEKALDYQEQEV